MSKDVEMKEVELNELEEKQPMTGDGSAEKNGSVKVKVPESSEVKFTGLSKDELMRVAGTAGWIRTRWLLLVLFWLGWLGMLAGAIVIIIQAPRCKPLPEMNWWNEGPLYQIRDVEAFAGDKGLAGVEEKLDSLNQLKVKGLILGPFHTVQVNEPATLDLNTIDPSIGTLEQLESLLDRAHKKGISIILDLTPNYESSLNEWFSGFTEVADKLKAAAEYWTGKGLDGILLHSLDRVHPANPAQWEPLQAAFQVEMTEGARKRALIGVADRLPIAETEELLNTTGIHLLLPSLDPSASGQSWASDIQSLYSGNPQTSLGWSLSRANVGHLATAVTPKQLRLYEIMLFTLPGTPVFNYGDEIGLEDQGSIVPNMVWDYEEPADENNATAKELKAELNSRRDLFRQLSDLRGKERSLAHGDYVALHNGTSSLAYVRLWDQSERFLTALNWGSAAVTLKLSHEDLPAQAQVRVTTEPDQHAQEAMVELDGLELGPGEALLLSYPFLG
ncbi:4F2 cell-surface antigen heavy chain-like [Clupea harengus]|uniref:4F2 cell-surface antigen heavy chain-like n=1 Tax=Clupea harengus TaxID=7950 RepID=A0A6P3VMQ4_CLUHA|nr:4F2 cell-surface antigen heavy chain-like [Clupea harengus]